MFVEVVVPLPIEFSLTYSVPEELKSSIGFGSVVEVPFRRKKILGFVIEVKSVLSEADLEKKFAVKAVEKVLLGTPVFSSRDLEFFKWISHYYQTTLGDVFFTVFPKVFLKEPSLPKKAGKKESVAVDLEKVQWDLTEDQEQALKQICGDIEKRAFNTNLLFGVTGSGKTEVYLRAVDFALKKGLGSIVLVPEISLTPQLRQRFESRFGSEVAVLHSSLSEKQRRNYWWDILQNKKKIVVGARSALFAPMQNIGLIVVDEEHDGSYKQDAGVRYNARDLSLVRAKMHNAPVILGSATPSVETYHSALNGKYNLLHLKNRPKARPMPSIEIVDLKAESQYSRESIIGPTLKAAIFDTLERKEQCMLFINRKGFSSFLLCGDCGHVPQCRNCSVSLTFYKEKKILKCHYCGHQAPGPSECTSCFGSNFRFVGHGTEAVEREVREVFSGVNVDRLDAESASTTKKLEEILERFNTGETQILVGTQMLAKGHDFPNVTLIGILLADMGIHIPDFRSSERAYQVLSQMAGRAGRGDKLGRVILQTYVPEHYVFRCVKEHDYKKLYLEEARCRQEFEYPPFSRMAVVEFRNKNELFAHEEVMKAAQLLDRLKLNKIDFEYLGPAPALISKVNEEYRWKLIIKSANVATLNVVLKSLRKNLIDQGDSRTKRKGGYVDVDPVQIV